jgi:hypothetical protein
MSNHRTGTVLRASLGLIALAAVLVLLGLAIAGPATAAGATPAPDSSAVADVRMRDTVVKAGEDVTIAAGESVATAVAFGGDVIVNGTVRNSVVAFGGDIRLGPTAKVGTDMSDSDATVVAIGGTVRRAAGAQVTGQTQTFDSAGWSDAVGWAAQRSVFTPWWGLSFIGWIVQTAFFLVLALVAAALMPTQMRAVERTLRGRPWASLGWGALSFFVIVPAILVVLVISIVGLLLVIPYALFVTLAYFFVTTAVGAFVAQRVLSGGGRKENLMLAVTLGVVGTTIVSRIPVVGPLLIMVMMVFGAGAAVLATVEWRRNRKQAAATAPQAAALAAGTAVYPATPPAAPIDATIAPQALAAGGDVVSPRPAGGAVSPATQVTEVRVGATEEPTVPGEAEASAEPEPPAEPEAPVEPEPPADDEG